MSPRPEPRYRASAWAAGGLVFAALAGAVWWMLSASAPGVVAETREPVARSEAGAEGERPLILVPDAARGPDLVLGGDDHVRFRTALEDTKVLGEGTLVVVVDPP